MACNIMQLLQFSVLPHNVTSNAFAEIVIANNHNMIQLIFVIYGSGVKLSAMFISKNDKLEILASTICYIPCCVHVGLETT